MIFNTFCACPNGIIRSVVEHATVKWSLLMDSIREKTGFARCDGWYRTGSPNLKLKVYLAHVCGSAKLASNCACVLQIRAAHAARETCAA